MFNVENDWKHYDTDNMSLWEKDDLRACIEQDRGEVSQWEVADRISAIEETTKGDELLQVGMFELALERYNSAFLLLEYICCEVIEDVSIEEIEQDMASVMASMAECLLGLREWEQAIKCAESSLSYGNWSNETTMLLLAKAQFQLKRYQQAMMTASSMYTTEGDELVTQIRRELNEQVCENRKAFRRIFYSYQLYVEDEDGKITLQDFSNYVRIGVEKNFLEQSVHPDTGELWDALSYMAANEILKQDVEGSASHRLELAHIDATVH